MGLRRMRKRMNLLTVSRVIYEDTNRLGSTPRIDGGVNAARVDCVDRDLLILAGDIATGWRARSFIAQQLKMPTRRVRPGESRILLRDPTVRVG